MQNYRYPNIKSQNDERYTNCRKTGYSILFIRTVLELYLCHLQLPILPCGFSSLPSVVEKLTGRTPRFTHLCTSLRSFKDGSLGIPGLIIYFIDITWYILAGNGLSEYSLVICNFLFCPVGFPTPFGRRKPYGPNSPIHSLLYVASLL